MTGPRIYRSALSVVLLAYISCSVAHAQKSAPTTSAGCGVLKDVTTCNWPAFEHALNSAHVVAVEHAKMDRSTGLQLAELAQRLGKSAASLDQPADLTFIIVPADEHGIDIGPNDQPILKLEIHAGPTSSGDLLWAETLRGTPDRPWPSSVRAVIDQFQARLAKPK